MELTIDEAVRAYKDDVPLEVLYKHRSNWEDRIDYQISVMQAFKAGSTIESTPKENAYWTVNDSPKWNWAEVNYRVKQEPKFVPYSFEDAEALIGKAVKIKNNSEIVLIVRVNKDYISLSIYGAYGFKHFLSECTWLDGSPCGKMS